MTVFMQMHMHLTLHLHLANLLVVCLEHNLFCYFKIAIFVYNALLKKNYKKYIEEAGYRRPQVNLKLSS